MILEKTLENIGNITSFAAVAFVFSVFKWLVRPDHLRCIKCLLLNVIIGVTVGVLSGMTALEYGFKDFTSLLIASVATYISRDIMDVVLERSFIKKVVEEKLNIGNDRG